MKFLAITLCLGALLASTNGQIVRPPPPKKNPPPPPFTAPLCTYLTGGATSISGSNDASTPPISTSGYAPSLMSLFNATLATTAFGKYYATGSGTGITSLIGNMTAYTFCTSFSDDPMTTAQEATFNAIYGQPTPTTSFKLTIPSVLGAYGFFANAGTKTTRATQTLKLTGTDMYNIYYGGGSKTRYTWKYANFLSAKDAKPVSNTTDAAFLSSTITPYSRADKSGTTALFKLFFYYSLCPVGTTCNTAALPTEILPASIAQVAFPTTWVTSAYTASGTAALCTAANSLLGAVAYSQRAICNPLTTLVEVQIKNKAGSYISTLAASTGDINQAAPTVIPAFDVPWSSINLLYTNGATTPPIVSYVYFFVKKKYAAAQFGVVQKFALFVTGQSSTLLASQQAQLLVPVAPALMSSANTFIKNNVLSY